MDDNLILKDRTSRYDFGGNLDYHMWIVNRWKRSHTWKKNRFYW